MLSPPWQLSLLAPFLALLAGCVQPVHEFEPMQTKLLEKQVNACRTLVLSVTPGDAAAMLSRHKLPPSPKREVTLGSAAPVSADGYFLTADHVDSGQTGNEFVLIYDVAGHRQYGRASVVWEDAHADLALLRSTLNTPAYYPFSPRDKDLPAGTQIFHTGMATGNKAQIGRLSERVSGRGTANFLHTLRLAPGDSGGPVLLLSGELVGVNSAVGYLTALDTTFFSASRSSRPDPRSLLKIIAKDVVKRQRTSIPP